MTSFIHRSSAAFSDPTMDRIVLDPLVCKGVMYRLDFLHPYSNPNADGVLTGGAIFKNLVEGASDATYVFGTGGFSVAAGKKGLISPGTDTGQSSRLDFLAGAFDTHTEGEDHNFVHHLWFRQDNGYNTNGSSLLGDRKLSTESDADSPYWGSTPGIFIACGYVGLGASPLGYIRSAGAPYQSAAVMGGSLVGSAHLVSLGYENGAIQLYVDGAAYGSPGTYGQTALGVPSRRSHGTLVFSANPSAGDTVTVNGAVITFVASGAAGAQVNIGTDALATAQELRSYINGARAALDATAEGNGTTLVVLRRAASKLLTMTKSSSSIALGNPVSAKSLRLTNYLKGTYFCLAGEDLTLSGRSALASVQAEYAGYKLKLTAAGI